MRPGRVPAAARLQKRLILPVALAVVLVTGTIMGAIAAVPFQVIVSSGPLTRITLGNELSQQVTRAGDTDFQFWPNDEEPGSAGTFIVVNDTLYAPDFTNHPGSATDSLGTYIAFTPVSQSAVTGTGTGPDPLRVTTVADVGTTGLRVTQTDSYIVGQEAYRTDIVVSNTGGAPLNAILYRGADCYLGGNDFGFAVHNASTNAIACSKTANNNPPDRIEQFLPITSGSNYYEASYSQVWAQIATKLPLPDTCRCTEDIDNGIAISWNITVPPGGQVSRAHLTAFSLLGTLPLTATKQADQAMSPAGTANGYTITITNPNAANVTITSITDVLPAGFSYIDNSTTGITTANPAIDGQRLTWNGPFPVNAGSFFTLHFGVTVAATAGTYLNNASAVAADGFSVGPTGDAAPITVTGGATATATPTGATATPSPTGSASLTATGSVTLTGTGTRTATITGTATPTGTPTPTSTITATSTATPLAQIAGRIFANEPNGPGLPNARVEVCRAVDVQAAGKATPTCNVTTSGTAGVYRVMSLQAGSYTVRAMPPVGEPLLDVRLGPFNLAGGQNLEGQDVHLSVAFPLPGDVFTTYSHTNEHGLPVLHWDVVHDIVKNNRCPGGTGAIYLDAWWLPAFPGDPRFGYERRHVGNLTHDVDHPGRYAGTYGPLRPAHGAATLVLDIVCPNGQHDTQRFSVWIDPSGFVKTVDGVPIEGATVTLFRSDAAVGPFTQVPNGSDIMSPGNRVNPDLTDATGHFGWDVLAGFYKVRAQKAGCVAPTGGGAFVETGVLPIPPPVTDLDLRLQCAGVATATPTVPLPTATRTPTGTLGATPTATLPPGAVSGRGFTLQVGGAIPAGDRTLTWLSGTLTKSAIYGWSPHRGFRLVGVRQPKETSVTDTVPINDPIYCYIHLAFVGDLNIGPDVHTASDLLCYRPGTGSGAGAPGAYRGHLDQSTTLTVEWTAPGGQTRYEVTRTRFDGSAAQSFAPSGALIHSEPIGDQATCLQVAAFNDQTLLGSTPVLCGRAGVETHPTGGVAGEYSLLPYTGPANVRR